MVTDIDRSVNFYKTLGLSLLQRWDNHYAILESPSVKIGLHPSEVRDTSRQVSIGFIIDNIEEVKALLDENDIDFSFEDDENSGKYLYFTDPDGVNLYYSQPTW